MLKAHLWASQETIPVSLMGTQPSDLREFRSRAETTSFQLAQTPKLFAVPGRSRLQSTRWGGSGVMKFQTPAILTSTFPCRNRAETQIKLGLVGQGSKKKTFCTKGRKCPGGKKKWGYVQYQSYPLLPRARTKANQTHSAHTPSP